ncbi:MAG: nickel-dependent lactate racemase [Candidatus Aminicenantes bacterium]|jgi:nickel-dependent lactate racemase
MNTIALKYGSEIFEFKSPGNYPILETRDPEYKITLKGFRRELLQALDKKLKPQDSVAIVIADKTRRCDYPTYLPVLCECLRELGIQPATIKFYIAYGSHNQQSDEESQQAYGAVYDNYSFIHHDCDDHAIFVNCGKTSRNTDMLIRRDILETDFIICFGAISHHYFAGYGGGRKLIFPGLGARQAINQNHRLFLDPQRKSLHANCQPGMMAANPLAQDLLEYEKACPPRLDIHGILNSDGQVCELLIGSTTGDFIRACEIHHQYFSISTSERFDIVLASAGGFPRDINFIQAHKALDNAAGFVKDGGQLLILAECRDGIGSDSFLPWFKMDQQAAFDQLLANYQGNGGTALALREKTRRIQIALFSQLDRAVCDQIQLRLTGIKEIRDILSSPRHNLAIIRNASVLVKR